ncbi:MAG: tetratricopeptide repeat protein [Clostridiales bacterium]|nr:tetratricopeptide repeat protein [Clostridiales bacterium]
MNRVIQFDKNENRYVKIAEVRESEGDLLGALSMLFSAEKINPTYKIYSKIADIYTQMELLELANKYWYKYMFCAPEDQVSICYEELAINYFYLDNLWASGYFLHKKLTVDGYITRDDIDKEVMDFFTGEEIKKYNYRVVYPYDKANYSFEIKSAKRALRSGAFKDAIESLKKVPSQCHDQETLGDFSLAYLMTDQFENAEELCRQSIEQFGDSVGAYCNLSTLYELKEDQDKADYYYKKALSLRTGEQDEPYKIATCSIERGDHQTSLECLEKILQDRPYEIPMRFFYAVALLNLGKYDSAVREFATIYKQDPKDLVIEYYLDLAKKIVNKQVSEKILPLKYVKEIPRKQALEWTKKIKDMAKTPDKFSGELKKKETEKMLLWGLESVNDQVVRSSAMLLSSKSSKKFGQIAFEFLLDPLAQLETKRLLLYALILKGYKGKIGVVIGSYYGTFVQKTLSCEKDKDGALYFSAYALCVSRMIFYGLEDLNKISQSANKVYKSLHKQISDAEVNNEELAALMLLECGLENLDEIEQVCKIFEVGQKKLQLLKNMLEK